MRLVLNLLCIRFDPADKRRKMKVAIYCGSGARAAAEADPTFLRVFRSGECREGSNSSVNVDDPGGSDYSAGEILIAVNFGERIDQKELKATIIVERYERHIFEKLVRIFSTTPAVIILSSFTNHVFSIADIDISVLRDVPFVSNLDERSHSRIVLMIAARPMN